MWFCLEQDVQWTDPMLPRQTSEDAGHAHSPEYKITNSQVHTGPRGRAEVNLTIIGELWGIIKVHRLQRTPAAGQNQSQDVQPPGRKTGGTSQDLPPPSALSFFIHHISQPPGLQTSKTISWLSFSLFLAVFLSESARPASSIFPIISYLRRQWDVLFGKERGRRRFVEECRKAGREEWEWDKEKERENGPGPRWTTKGPVSQRQLREGGEGSQERPWLGPGPARSTRTGSTLTALGRERQTAAAPSRHRGQDRITNYTSTQPVYLRLDRKKCRTLWVQRPSQHFKVRLTHTWHHSPAALSDLSEERTQTHRDSS